MMSITGTFGRINDKLGSRSTSIIVIIGLVTVNFTGLFLLLDVDGEVTSPSPDIGSRSQLRSAARAQELVFKEYSSGLYTSGSFNFIVIEDFNNDNKYDIAFSAEDSNGADATKTGLYAYTGNGGTAWTNASTGLWRGNAWAGIDLADADGDGYTEYYASDAPSGTNNNSGTKVWEYRSGTWTDSAAHVSTPLKTGRPYNVYMINVSGDSRLDMVVCNRSGMKYYENSGGNPVTWRDRSTGLPTTGDYTALDVEDMNKDGLPDIVSCDYSTNEYLFIQNTTGGFHWSSYSSGFNAPGIALGVELEDVNNDTHKDIVFGCRGGGLYCVLGNSGGVSGTSFQWTVANTGLPGGSHYYDIKVVDIDLDGDFDIVAPSYSNIGIRIYLGNGNTNPGAGMSWTLASNTNITQTGRWISVDCKDINKDGSLDIAAASYGSGVKVYLNNITMDVTPPGQVTDLSTTEVTTNSIKVNWTAPSDNGTDTNSGPVYSYDLRYHTSPLDLANWNSAVQCSGEPAPAAPGTVQEFNITGLQPGTKYYIALRTRDERPNYSPLSNVIWNTTIGLPDTTPPGKIYDLSAYGPTNNSINLTWTAPANNGTDASSGPAAAYDIRYYSASVTNGTWALATSVAQTPVPGTPGTTETCTVNGLASETTYYFAVKTRDAKPNWGYISNSVFGTTLMDPDLTPPAAVSDLAFHDITATTMNLTWTAPGDDGLAGDASEYSLRYSNTMINYTNWNTATAVSGVPSPGSQGSPEHFNVTGLTPETLYYFALRTADEVPNWSPLAVVADYTLPLLDETAPPAIDDLKADQVTESSTRLFWTAPGDDGTSGTVSGYEIRYSTSNISDANWASASLTSGTPTPLEADSFQEYTVTGLLSETTYYFAVRSYDERPNWSPLSNIAIVTTKATDDNTAPSAITDLEAAALSSNSVELTWTAPGDDNDSGNATGYSIRFSTVTITEFNWDSVNRYPNELIPKAPSSPESIIVKGLFSNTTYYFGIKAFDEKPNISDLSNIASVKTNDSKDIIPPEVITDLSVITTTESSASLTWTAPGDDNDVGSATVYDIRYAESKITETTWSVSKRAINVPTPAIAGSTESFTVTGLDPQTTYYFAVKSADEKPNWSPLSNSPFGTTKGNALPQLTITITSAAGQVTAGDTVVLTVSVKEKLNGMPLELADISMSSDIGGTVFSPGSGKTDENGELKMIMTAPDVAVSSEITVFADVSSMGFKSNRSWLILKVIPSTAALKFNLHVDADSITLTPADYKAGDNLTITAVVSNLGTADATSFTVKVSVDGSQVGFYEQFTALAANDTVTIVKVWLATSGQHRITVTVLADEIDLETTTDDNSVELSVTVPERDGGTNPTGEKEDGDKLNSLSYVSILAVMIISVIVVMITMIVLLKRRKKQEHIQTLYPPVPPPELTPAAQFNEDDGNIYDYKSPEADGIGLPLQPEEIDQQQNLQGSTMEVPGGTEQIPETEIPPALHPPVKHYTKPVTLTESELENVIRIEENFVEPDETNDQETSSEK